MESEKSAELQCKGGDFYWLSWFSLYFIAHDWLSAAELSYSEKKTTESLLRYLTNKKYVCFLGWNELPTDISLSLSYKKFYNWIATDLTLIPYNKIYNFGLSGFFSRTTIFSFYNHHYDWIAASEIPAFYIRAYRFGLLPIAVQSFYFP